MRKLVGLTGGIGSGKSTVAELLAQLGAYIVDADQIAREVVRPGTPGLRALVAEFGAAIVSEDGSLNRQALADIAFATPRSKAKLDDITHPLIVARTSELFDAAPADAIVVHDVALLAELGIADNYDAVIVVDADDEVRVHRLIERGMREDDARQRLLHQSSRQARLDIADYVITNDGSFAALSTAVDRVWRQLTALAN